MDADEPNLPIPSPPTTTTGTWCPTQCPPPDWALVDAIPEFAIDYPPPPARRVWVPVLLFFATCASTFFAGTVFAKQFTDDWPQAMIDGLLYSGAVMTILLCHEMGHFVQAWRHGVFASLPYFLPVPIPPIGTFGAVIVMEPRRGDRKGVFDIGISGPLAGLVPTLFFLCLGLSWSRFAQVPLLLQEPAEQFVLGQPLLMQWLAHWLKGGQNLVWHPFAVAGWVGLLVTSINLMPIGQLDGGHILYGMFREKAHAASLAVLVLAISATVAWKLTNWWLMLGLIMVMGTRHPPTADDSVPLGLPRYVLGMLTLAFLFLGFTPNPIGFTH